MKPMSIKDILRKNGRIGMVVALFTIHCSLFISHAVAQNVVDEVIWVVGDEAILMSDVEAMRIEGRQEGIRWSGDPDCAIPEQIAVQKLFLNQAII